MRPLRLLHTSDVHVGGGYRAPDHGEHHDHCLCPILAIERLVVSTDADGLLVVGDLFDNARIGDELVVEVLGRLDTLGVPCVVIAGNHDVHDDTSVYRRDAAGGSIAERPGLHFLDNHDGASVDLFDGALTVWGKAMPIHDRSFRPLHGASAGSAPPGGAMGWRLVLGHGHYEPDGDAGGFRSSPISPADIEATAAHYVALGHWHVRTDVSTENVAAWYSGAPYGVAASQQLNLIDLHPGTGVTVGSVPVELPVEGCATIRV